jgi:hypothetical protein
MKNIVLCLFLLPLAAYHGNIYSYPNPSFKKCATWSSAILFGCYLCKWVRDYTSDRYLGKKLRIAQYDEPGTSRPMTHETFKFYNWGLEKDQFRTAQEIRNNAHVVTSIDNALTHCEKAEDAILLLQDDGTPFTPIVNTKGATIDTQRVIIATMEKEILELNTTIKNIASLTLIYPFSGVNIADRISTISSLSELFILKELGRCIRNDEKAFFAAGSFDKYIATLSHEEFTQLLNKWSTHLEQDARWWKLSTREKERMTLYIQLIQRKTRLDALKYKYEERYHEIQKSVTETREVRTLIINQRELVDHVCNANFAELQRRDIDQLSDQIALIMGTSQAKWRNEARRTDAQRLIILGLESIKNATDNIIVILERRNAPGHDAQRSNERDATRKHQTTIRSCYKAITQ